MVASRYLFCKNNKNIIIILYKEQSVVRVRLRTMRLTIIYKCVTLIVAAVLRQPLIYKAIILFLLFSYYIFRTSL